MDRVVKKREKGDILVFSIIDYSALHSIGA